MATRCVLKPARLGWIAAVLWVAVGCASAPYEPADFDPSMLASHAETQSEGSVSVTAAVPGERLSAEIFGFPIYDRGIQPVWLSIRNDSTTRIRYPLAGTDREYFSPLEVAYMHREGFSKEGREAMERRLYGMRMERTIPAGETRSGFVFTNASPGTKNLFVEVFGNGEEDHAFAFFLRVPGFEPDHSRVDFASLYSADQRREFGEADFSRFMREWGCCTRSVDGETPGLPISALLVGSGEVLLLNLLRSGWYETDWKIKRDTVDPAATPHLFARMPDATFRLSRDEGGDRNELRIWLSPWRIDDQPVWVAHITHFIAQGTRLQQALFGSLFDPHVDDARNFLLQNFLYNQAIDRFGWLDTGLRSSMSTPNTNFNGAEYFSDGHILVAWMPDKPVSVMDVRTLDWDDAPGHLDLVQ